MKEIFNKFMPPGKIFESESALMDRLFEGITKNFSVAEEYILARINEIPGSLNTDLPRWEAILSLSQKSSVQERNNAVLGKLNSIGGGSLTYLRKVASKLAGQSIAINDDTKPLLIEVSGIRLEHLESFSCTSICAQQLREFAREESIIAGIESIKHAHLGSRYYDKEKTVYAQD